MLDYNNEGCIRGLDLARSLVAPASIKIIDRLLDRVRICAISIIFFVFIQLIHSFLYCFRCSGS